ncbi:MAG: hypothetical protein JSW07_09315, partial [bacterium]
MKIREAFQNIRTIHYLKDSPRVVETTAKEFVDIFPKIEIKTKSVLSQNGKAILNITIATPHQVRDLKIKQLENQRGEYIYFQIHENGSGWLICSHANFLYSFACHLLENMIDHEIDIYIHGKIITPAFNWQRIVYDYFLTQPGRIQRNLNRATYVRELGRLGFTHIEVNGLAYPMGLETGPKGEIYPMLYTYCPALDQFVYSSLNKGLYPEYYLSANLNFLKENAKLAVQYGLTPGLLCFEPRSVPEEFFDRYPMLRGCYVEHPFRSFKPRYNMTITHPKVREHYAEMMKKLMHEVPELGFISIWTNDSGAGFEYTKSLYVGRNGGAYLIREWKDDEEIARLAIENALRFLQILRNAGAEVNPDFRVITRMEPFYGEHEIVWNGLGKHVDVEGNSLAAVGWDMLYTHPKYPDIKEISGGTVYQLQFDEREKSLMTDLENRGALAYFYFAVGPHIIFDPLMGLPYPQLTYQRLKILNKNGVSNLAHHGGSFPPEKVPYNVNHEIVRLFQYDSKLKIEKVIAKIALKWTGEKFYKQLAKAWELTEEAILAFPNVVPLYSSFGFTWYRLWARPFVSNLEEIPQDQRAYYEDFICTTPHNPNNVDLSRDVLFQLTTPEKSRSDLQRIDQNV